MDLHQRVHAQTDDGLTTGLSSSVISSLLPPDHSMDNFRVENDLRRGPKSHLGTSQTSSSFTSRNSSAVHIAKERESYNYFRSRRVRKEDIQQPWKAVKDPREKWVTIIPLIGIALGFIVAGYLIYSGLKTVVKHQYTLVFDDDFSHGFNDKIWTKESNVGGFG